LSVSETRRIVAIGMSMGFSALNPSTTGYGESTRMFRYRLQNGSNIVIAGR
jgi:hypothetical protein